jgi:hypothetical protein
MMESHQEMLQALQRIRDESRSSNVFIEDLSLRNAEAALAALNPTSSFNDDIWKLRLQIAQGASRLGEEELAIGLFEELLATMDQTSAGKNPFNRPKMLFQLGVAYLRHAETLNCCQRFTAESCVFPIQGAGVHERKEASRKAIDYFEKTLKTTAKDNVLHLRARWLVNIAYMTTGEYPDQVPPEYLIAPHRFESDFSFPRFANVTQEIGLDAVNAAGGAVGDDFDNDGDLDLLVSSWAPDEQLQYFRNNGNGSFVNATEQAGLAGFVGGGLNMVQADYDNDGDVDVLILRGAWLGKSGNQPNSLLCNLGGGRFVDVAYAAGIAGNDYPTQTGAWADYDNDGDLDLFIGNESEPRNPAPSQLFRNNDDGTFSDVAQEAGVTNDLYAKGAVWGDVDADGYPDLYVSNMDQRNRLYRNNRDGTFTDVAPEVGVELPLVSFATWFWDYDNDGDLDLYVNPYRADISDIAASYLGLPVKSELPRLYRNDGDWKLTNVAPVMGLTRTCAPMGANFGDLDNDGYLDFYLGTGDPSYFSLMPNLMFLNREGRSFVDVTFDGGFGSLQKGHAVVFADFDHDGDQDVFEQMGGALKGDKFVNAFYENPGFGRNWISLDLVGHKSNRSAIGAVIHLVVSEDGRERSIYKHVNSGGSFGANPLRQAIGVGSAASILSLSVHWPTTQSTQVFEDVRPNRFYRVTEGRNALDELNMQRIELDAEPAN